MDSLKPHRFNLDVEDKYFYDEKKKRFVNYPNIPLIYLQQFRYNHFKTQRPDLFGIEQDDFQNKFRLAQSYLRYLNYQRKLELRKLWRTMGILSFHYAYPLLDDYFQNRSIDTPRMLRLWTWEDSTKMVNFLNQELHRARIFGLVRFHQTTKEKLKEEEDNLTDYYLYLMNSEKKPADN